MNTDRRFLNYKEYENFKLDLRDGKISEDTIVFIQDKRCIWARGKEYTGNLALDYNKESKIATLKTADGESIIDFVDKNEYIDFKSTFINFVTNEYAVFKNNTNASLITVTDELLAEINRSVLVDSDIDTRLTKEITNRQVSYGGLSLNIGRIERELLDNIENVNNDLTSTKETLNEVDNRVDSLENLIEADQDGIINKFNEIANFLNQIPNSNGDPNLKQLLADIASTIPDVSNKADKSEIPTVPTNVSAFINDAGYLTSADIEGVGNVDERQLNAKLKTLQEYFADQYVLKKDIQTPETNVWSEATIYPFGELPESEIGETPMYTSIKAYREDVYNQLERDGAIRNNICYLIYKES